MLVYACLCLQLNIIPTVRLGCAQFVAGGLNFNYHHELKHHDFETNWIEGTIRKTKYVIVYRTCGVPASDFLDYLDDVVKTESQSGKEVVITGDLNCNCLKN